MSFVRAARVASRSRAFSSTVVSRKDLVQDLYIKELKTYKPAPPAKDAHVGAVKSYSLPPKPKAPAVTADFASELNAYDASEPAIATEATPSASAAEDSQVGGADAFLEYLEQDLPKKEEHHH